MWAIHVMDQIFMNRCIKYMQHYAHYQKLNLKIGVQWQVTIIKYTRDLAFLVFFLFFFYHISVENSYRPVARGYLALGSGNLLPQVGSPDGRPKMALSQLLDVPQQSIATEIRVQLID